MLAKPTPQRIQELQQQGYTQKDIATIYGRSERMVRYWNKDNNEPKQKRGRKTKIRGKSLITLFFRFYTDNKSLTQQEMADYLSQLAGQKISRFSVLRMLKQFDITHKKLTYHYTLLDVAKAKVFAKETKLMLEEHPFLAIDECSFYPNEDPRFGYSLQGTRAIAKRPRSKGDCRYTLLLCIKNSKQGGIIHYKLIEKGANTKIFHDFLEEINLSSSEKHYLLLDNASIHDAHDKRKELNLLTIEEQLAKKNIEVKYITPYAPMLNPVELCFNFLRQQTEKQRPRSYEELKLAIEKTIKALNQQDLNERFKHCVNYKFGEDNKDDAHSVWRILDKQRGRDLVTWD